MESRRQLVSDRVRAENSNQSSSSFGSMKRDHTELDCKLDSVANESDTERGRKKKKSRWMGDVNEKAIIPGMPTMLPSGLGQDQQEAYVAQLQIQELTRKLRAGDFGISQFPGNRSPSPEPFYGVDGKRLNTREYRMRKKCEEERHRLISRLKVLNPDYRPPSDYRAPFIKIIGRVDIPQEEHPDINFIGLIIGPRGNTLQGLEKETGSKIIIRGKGSVKDGKVSGKGSYPGEDEPLHAYITSMSQECVQKACDKIKEIIRLGIEMPESQNALRKTQLLELARLNGTLREGDLFSVKCSNCGSTSHRTWTCPDKPNVTGSIICTGCGGAGHIQKDCKVKRPGLGGAPIVNYTETAKMDEEYMSLMAELGESAPNSNNDVPSGRGQRSLSMTPHLFDKRLVPKAICAPPPSLLPPITTSQQSSSSPQQEGMSKEISQPLQPPPSKSWNYSTYTSYPMMWPPVPSPQEPPPPGMQYCIPASTCWQSESKPPPPPPNF